MNLLFWPYCMIHLSSNNNNIRVPSFDDNSKTIIIQVIIKKKFSFLT